MENAFAIFLLNEIHLKKNQAGIQKCETTILFPGRMNITVHLLIFFSFPN